MKRFKQISIFCATTLLLAACGGDKSAITDGGDGGGGGGDDKDEDIALVGIPRSMVSAICFDANTNNLCDTPEILEYRYDFGGASIYQPDNRYKSSKAPILVEISDPAKTAFFDKTTLSFPGDSKKLSMDMFLKTNGGANIEKDNGFFLAHQHNLNLLGQNGLSAEDAGDASLKEMKTTIGNLSAEDKKTLAKEGWIEILSFNHARAYEIAKKARGEEKGLVNDKLVEGYQCKAGLVRTVQHYGVEDIFDLSNGAETASPSLAVTNHPDVIAYNNNVGQTTTSDYDETSNNRYFADEVNSLPSGIVSGRLWIGLKSNGSSLQHNDGLLIGKFLDPGNYFYERLNRLKLPDGTGSQPYSMKWQNQLVSTTNPTTDVLWQDFSKINFSASSSLLNYIQTNNKFDVSVQDDTAVDFITVATCSKKDPIVEITPILEKFQCKDNETRKTILGGLIDAYANGTDTATPSSALISVSSTTVDYDSTSYDKHFKETLDLSTLTGYISRARLSVGVKALGSALHSNDRIYLGYLDAPNRAAFDVYGSSSSSVNTSPEWAVTPISNGERVIQSHFSAGTGANSLAWLRTQNAFDMLIQDDTSVDFAQLDLCMREKAPCIDTDGDGYCDDDEKEAGSDPTNPDSTPGDIDGDGVPNGEDCDPTDPDVWDDCKPKLPASCDKEISIDLRPATSWLNTSGVAPTENNVFASTIHSAVWDPAMNWFDFGSASNTDHELKIDFCSCGGGDIKVDEMKSDNFSSIKLDNGAAIVERTAHSQSTMGSWGPNVSGTTTFPHTGNGVNHSLVFKVTNVGGPSGGAVNGTLGFTGHLGKCTKEDVLPRQIKP